MRAGNLSAFSFAPTYTVTANFDNVGGLKVRAPVKSAGVVVGRIAGISFDDKTFQAVVSINLETTYKFPKDSSAAILTSGLLGEQYLGLTPGSEEELCRGRQNPLYPKRRRARAADQQVPLRIGRKARLGRRQEPAKTPAN